MLVVPPTQRCEIPQIKKDENRRSSLMCALHGGDCLGDNYPSAFVVLLMDDGYEHALLTTSITVSSLVGSTGLTIVRRVT